VVCRLCGVPLRLVSAFGALARVSSSASHVLTAGRVNPDGGVSGIGGNYLHRDIWLRGAGPTSGPGSRAAVSALLGRRATTVGGTVVAGM